MGFFLFSSFSRLLLVYSGSLGNSIWILGSACPCIYLFFLKRPLEIWWWFHWICRWFWLVFSSWVCAYSVVSNSLQPYGLYNLPGSSVHGTFQANMLEQVSISHSRGSSQPRDRTRFSSSAVADGFLTTSTTWEALVLSS